MASPVDTSYIPRHNIPTVYVYPKVDQAMSYSKKSYAFIPTKLAPDQMLQILLGITHTAPLASALQLKFIKLCQEYDLRSRQI
jgi:hypothetical protein